MINDMRLAVPAMSENEALARAVVGAFAARANPRLDELEDVRTAVSEAVTNAILHGYGEAEGTVELYALLEGEVLTVEVTDRGCGIGDLAQAMEPFYTGSPQLERSGMGFTIMESFMDSLQVETAPGEGTRVRMVKRFAPRRDDD